MTADEDEVERRLDELPDPPLFYDRQGKPITLRQYAEYNGRQRATYKRLASDLIGGTRVSTIWLGIDYGFSVDHTHRPLIFETMTFATDGAGVNWSGDGVWRYATEDEARAGHEAVCAEVRAHLADAEAAMGMRHEEAT